LSDPRQQPNEVGIPLGKKCVGSEVSRFGFRVGIGVGRPDDDRDAGQGFLPADLLENLQPDAHGVARVEDHQRRPDGAEVVQRFLPGGDGLGTVTDAGQQSPERLASLTVVIDD
jgi:hypothetical protein